MTSAKEDQPRRHHYEFAHRALPSIMLNPNVDLDRLAGDLDRLGTALRATWESVGSKQETAERLSNEGLSVERRDVGDAEGLLINLPAALHVAEAIFVMVTPLNPPSSRRFFALDAGWDVVNQRPYTVLGEWSDRGHTNHGDGPAADGDAFIAAVARACSR